MTAKTATPAKKTRTRKPAAAPTAAPAAPVAEAQAPAPVRRNIYQKLHAIQSAVNGLAKDKKGFGYMYVTGDKVLEHIKPLMNDLGLLLKQEVLGIENTRQDYQTKTGQASEILSKVEMKFTWVDIDTGETDVNLFGANGQNGFDKGVGSALTYAERYFLLKYFHIATDQDDIDNPDRKKEEPAPAPAPAPQAPKQVNEPPMEARVANMLKKDPEPVPAPASTEGVDQAIFDTIAAASSLADLAKIYNENAPLHTNKNFVEALAARKAEVKGATPAAA